MSLELHIRPMQEPDLALIMEIETIVYPHPWSLQTFQDCLRVGYRTRVLELNQQLIGYGLMSVGAGEAHILNLCVHPQYRRCGYGKRILNHLIRIAQQEEVKTVFLEVRVSNHAAIELYRQVGFNEVGLRKNYYLKDHGREDGLIFACDLLFYGL